MKSYSAGRRERERREDGIERGRKRWSVERENGPVGKGEVLHCSHLASAGIIICTVNTCQTGPCGLGIIRHWLYSSVFAKWQR